MSHQFYLSKFEKFVRIGIGHVLKQLSVLVSISAGLLLGGSAHCSGRVLDFLMPSV